MEVQWLQQKWSYLLYFTHRSYLISFNRTTAPGQLQGVKIHALSHRSLFPCRLALQRAGRSPPPPPPCITAGSSHSRSPGTTGSLPKTQPRCPAGAGGLSFLLFSSSGSDELPGDSAGGPCSWAKRLEEERSRKDPRPWDSLPTRERLPDAWDQQHHTSLARTEMAAVWIITA